MRRLLPAFGAAMALAAFVSPAAFAADPVPEIQRSGTVPAQPAGSVHTLRQIPEACARLEGAFTGQAAEPYKFAVVRSSPWCAQGASTTPSTASARPDSGGLPAPPRADSHATAKAGGSRCTCG